MCSASPEGVLAGEKWTRAVKDQPLDCPQRQLVKRPKRDVYVDFSGYVREAAFKARATRERCQENLSREEDELRGKESLYYARVNEVAMRCVFGVARNRTLKAYERCQSRRQ